MASEIGKRIDEIITLDLGPRLKVAGYRKRGRTFHAASPDHVKVVNVQASRWNEGNTGSFTVNLGVFFPEVATLSEARPLRGPPKEYHCTVRQRLGLLMHDGKDIWWRIDSTTVSEVLARKVGTAWSVFARPWLERVSDLSGAHAELVSQKMCFRAAMISLLLRRPSEASELLREAERRRPHAASKIRDWGRRHDLL